jgi:hypothetical protein
MSEVAKIPAPFSLAQQWVRIGKHCLVEKKTMRLISMVTSPTILSACGTSVSQA